MKYKLFEVGGKVRDELMGIESNDVDYCVVIFPAPEITSAAVAFEMFTEQLKSEGHTIYASMPDRFAIRTAFPKDHPKFPKMKCDFTLAVKGDAIGDLKDDLCRRDFTMNAIAKDVDTGAIIDFFGGADDIANRLIRCVGYPIDTFKSDPLRIVRALRFSMTKHMYIDDSIWLTISDFYLKLDSVSDDRLLRELDKMFRHNSMEAFDMLNKLNRFNSELYRYITSKFWFKPNIKKV